MKNHVRLSVIKALLAWEKHFGVADAVLETVLSEIPNLESADRRLCTHLFYGVLRMRAYLDEHIRRLTKKTIPKIDPSVLQALRVGLYQILFMDRIPERAAVFETVEALNVLRTPKWLTGFANAVLRSAVREGLRSRGTVFETRMPQDARLSHPEWLLARFSKRYGHEEATALCMLNNTQPELVLNVNVGKIDRNAFIAPLHDMGIEALAGTISASAVRLPGFRGEIPALPGYDSGQFIVQDEAAQLVAPLLQPLDSDHRGSAHRVAAGRYLDACAGLGGKTCHLAWLLPEGNSIVALEPTRERAWLLRKNLERTGDVARVAIHETSLAEYSAKAHGSFDGILLDAPCSGLGVIRRNPDIRWNRSEADLVQYHEKQLTLLGDAGDLLLPGGILVYCVCSLEPEETDAVIGEFLDAHPNFVLTDPREALPAAARGFVDEEGLLRTLPHTSGLDGFFSARLMKNVQ